MIGGEVDVIAGAALGASTSFLLSAMICTNVSLILLTALASLSTEKDPTSLDASHVFGASDVPGCSSRGTNAAPAAAAMLAAGEAVSSSFDGNPVGLDVNPVGPAWSIHGSTKLLTSSWWPSRSATARSSRSRCATLSCLLHSPKPGGSTKNMRRRHLSPPILWRGPRRGSDAVENGIAQPGRITCSRGCPGTKRSLSTKLLMIMAFVATYVHARQGKIRHELAALSDENLILLCTIHALIKYRLLWAQSVQTPECALFEDLGGAGALKDVVPAHQVLQEAHKSQTQETRFLLCAAELQKVFAHVGGHGTPQGTVRGPRHAEHSHNQDPIQDQLLVSSPVSVPAITKFDWR